MGKCIFQDAWLEEEEYGGWIARDPSCKFKFRCRLCKQSYELGKMGLQAIKSHAKKKKHVDLEKSTANSIPMTRFLDGGASSRESTSAIDSAVRPPVANPTAPTPSSSSTTSTTSVVQFSKSDALRAEIKWTKELLVSASAARSKYVEHQRELEKQATAARTGEKRKAAQGIVDSLNAKKARVEEDISALTDKADRLCQQAEEKECLRLISEANALRVKAKEKKASLAPLQKDIEEAMANLKKLE